MYTSSSYPQTIKCDTLQLWQKPKEKKLQTRRWKYWKVLQLVLDIPIFFENLLKFSQDVPQNTIHGTIWDLDKKNEQTIKPERGLFILKKYAEGAIEKRSDAENNIHLPTEASFYQSFADYLVQDLEECTKAISLGGNKFGDKWGTPDVFGVYKFSEADAVRPPVEIVSVEIKTDTNQLITAFGQACAYKLLVIKFI